MLVNGVRLVVSLFTGDMTGAADAPGVLSPVSERGLPLSATFSASGTASEPRGAR